MDKKLTLSLDGRIIEKAKLYAKANKTSISKMIESYLGSLTQEKKSKKEIEITPLVESLSGVIDLLPNFDYKEEYGKYLAEKYK